MGQILRDTQNPLYTKLLNNAQEFGEEDYKPALDNLQALGATYEQLCDKRDEVERRSGELAGELRAIDLQWIDTPKKDRVALATKRGLNVMETQAQITEVFTIQTRHRASRIAYLRALQSLATRLNNEWAMAHDVGLREKANYVQQLSYRESSERNQGDDYMELQARYHVLAAEQTRLRNLTNEARVVAQMAETVIKDLERVRDSEKRVARGALTPMFRS